jgi:hypothetical protein
MIRAFIADHPLADPPEPDHAVGAKVEHRP